MPTVLKQKLLAQRNRYYQGVSLLAQLKPTQKFLIRMVLRSDPTTLSWDKIQTD